MSVVDPVAKFGSMKIRGKIGKPGDDDPGDVTGIYQMRPRKTGEILVRMPFYRPTGSPGAGQILQRQKMRELVAMWQAFDSTTKARYNLSARSKQMTGFNWFLHLTLPTYVPVGTPGFKLLLENGDFLLQENSGKILLDYVLLLAENSDFITTEAGNKIIK